ncbi:unnamed protein product [Hymenolepis diminuta]|uniref:Uncharacterized protein n=1 Tax=Hymenolepis diminuta TaxID=6216 RepID=A0A564YQ55_HYMDI|nr:unnamed protein product [Hymenolepis diminuta]
MCEIVNLVTSGSLPINIVCLQVAYSYRSEKLIKCTSDNSCRGKADSVTFRNQSCLYYPSIFLRPSRSFRAHIQLCPHARFHSTDEYE